MKNSKFIDVHTVDGHSMVAVFVAGAIGSECDIGQLREVDAKTWELTNK